MAAGWGVSFNVLPVTWARAFENLKTDPSGKYPSGRSVWGEEGGVLTHLAPPPPRFSSQNGGNLLCAVDESNDHMLSVWDWAKDAKVADSKVRFLSHPLPCRPGRSQWAGAWYHTDSP